LTSALVAQLIGFQAPISSLLLHGNPQLSTLLLSFLGAAFGFRKSAAVVALLLFQLLLELSDPSVAFIGHLFQLYLQLLLALQSVLKLPGFIVALRTSILLVSFSLLL